MEGSVNYIEGSVSHAFTDNLSIDQYLVLSDSNEQAFGVGISYVTPFGADITANVKLFNNKDLYSTLFFNYGDLTLSYYNYNTENPYDSSEEQLMLSNYFHGIIDEETLSVSYFKTLTDNLNLRSTALYTKYINETSYSADVELGYMFTNLWDISVGVGYVGSDSEYYSSNGEIRTTFSLSIPLSSNIYASSYVSYQGDTIETTESFEYNGKYIDRLGYRLRTQDSDIASEGYLSHSHKNEYVDGTVNASVNENESFGSFLIKNSQVITNGKIYFTSEESDSYIVVEPEINNTSKEIKDQKTVVGYSIIGNESNEERVEQETTGKLIAVSEYEEYDYDFLLNNNDYILDESSSISVSYFSIPGSVHIVNPYLIKSDQDIIKLVNINGDYVENASCEGESCISSTELTPGVYQVNSTRESIILASNDSVCLVDPKESIKVDLGYCFPNVEPLEKFELDGKEYVFISAAFGEKGTKHQLEYLDEEVRGEVKVQELNEKLNLLYIEVSDRTMKYFSSRTEYINKQELKSISSIYKLATRDSEKYANK
ncbi:CFA/I fimbrial subunit C precursor [Vibrio ishigakensis]|uniref:CFA/I fimbrial subunit C n=1 Tax=Vibrio ishigakensis TaxID=1481914 RepID=A0A0B8PQ56_9VIBR|nr:CFA/I fimbrial subunit C precursor [Vibrio ishigakensis]